MESIWFDSCDGFRGIPGTGLVLNVWPPLVYWWEGEKPSKPSTQSVSDKSSRIRNVPRECSAEASWILNRGLEYHCRDRVQFIGKHLQAITHSLKGNCPSTRHEIKQDGSVSIGQGKRFLPDLAKMENQILRHRLIPIA